MQEYKLIDNSADKQYEIEVNGLIARLRYVKDRDKIYLTHTEVPTRLSGKGIGSALVQLALEDIKEKGLSLGSLPQCPFVTVYVKRHPDWDD